MRRGGRGGGGRSYWDAYPRFEAKPRREAKDGIKAKSKRGDIGETWWSKRFVRVLESFNIGARLSRGRSYARSGQVMGLTVRPGEVAARVQGSRRTPYEVRIGLRELSEPEWGRIEDALAERAIYLAKLLAGEMPREIEEVFAGCRLALFPSSTRDLETSCSCPDWSNPCKHIAATYYILAERFDEDPFEILAWRGRGKESLLARLRALRDAHAEADDDSAPPPVWEPTAAGVRWADELAGFWRPGAEVVPLCLRPEIPALPHAMLLELGRAPVSVRGRPIGELLAPVYRVLSDATVARALGDIEDT